MQFSRVCFNEKIIKVEVPAKPSIYKIYAKIDAEEIALKIGISINLSKRLVQHAASKQKYLTLKPDGSWLNRADVVSKRSILAKHLYFENLFEAYDLKTEQGRQRFLQEKCYILFCVTKNREQARDAEKTFEDEGDFRYVGRTSHHKMEQQDILN